MNEAASSFPFLSNWRSKQHEQRRAASADSSVVVFNCHEQEEQFFFYIRALLDGSVVISISELRVI